MKKLTFASTVLVTGALILSACNTPGTMGQDGGIGSPQVGTTGTVLPTSDLFGNDDSSPQTTTTVAAPGSAGDSGGSVFSTGTPDASTGTTGGSNTGGNDTGSNTGNNNGSQAATQTPAASTGSQSGSQTGSQAGSQTDVTSGLVRLSDVMQHAVNASDNQPLGQVRGVLLTGPAISGTGGQNPSVNVEGPQVSYLAVDVVNTESGSTQATVAPTAESQYADANRVYGESWSQIAGQNDLVLVPWQAMNFDQAGSLSTDLEAADFAGAPHFSAATPPDFAAGNWNATIDQYWTGQNLGIAVTGSTGTQIGQPVLLTAPFTGINLSLGSSQNVAQVQDFLVDPNTGTIQYVVVSGGSLGQTLLPVPAGALNWNQVTTLGAESGLSAPQNFTIDVSPEMFNQAPTLDSLNNLGSNLNWRQGVDEFWSDYVHTGSESVK